MTSKKEFEQVFNSLLGTDIPWSKLPKESLVELAVLFKNPDILLKRIKGGGSAALGGVGREIALGILETWEGPIAKGLKKVMAEKSDS